MDKIKLNTNIRDILASKTETDELNDLADMQKKNINEITVTSYNTNKQQSDDTNTNTNNLTDDQQQQLKQWTAMQQQQQLQFQQLQQLQQFQQLQQLQKQTVQSNNNENNPTHQQFNIKEEEEEVVEDEELKAKKEVNTLNKNRIINELKTPILLFILFAILTSSQYLNILHTYAPRLGNIQGDVTNTNILGMLMKSMIFVFLFVIIRRYVLQ